jgi:Protein of unknown function (DUF4244)
MTCIAPADTQFDAIAGHSATADLDVRRRQAPVVGCPGGAAGPVVRAPDAGDHGGTVAGRRRSRADTRDRLARHECDDPGPVENPVAPDAGMSTVEYAVGTVVAAAFAAVLYRIVTGDSIVSGLTNLIDSALNTSF